MDDGTEQAHLLISTCRCSRTTRKAVSGELLSPSPGSSI